MASISPSIPEIVLMKNLELSGDNFYEFLIQVAKVILDKECSNLHQHSFVWNIIHLVSDVANSRKEVPKIMVNEFLASWHGKDVHHRLINCAKAVMGSLSDGPEQVVVLDNSWQGYLDDITLECDTTVKPKTTIYLTKLHQRYCRRLATVIKPADRDNCHHSMIQLLSLRLPKILVSLSDPRIAIMDHFKNLFQSFHANPDNSINENEFIDEIAAYLKTFVRVSKISHEDSITSTHDFYQICLVRFAKITVRFINENEYHRRFLNFLQICPRKYQISATDPRIKLIADLFDTVEIEDNEIEETLQMLNLVCSYMKTF